MQPNPILKHFTDIVKGALGAALAAGIIAFLNYLGLHIPAVVTPLTALLGGVTAVKLG